MPGSSEGFPFLPEKKKSDYGAVPEDQEAARPVIYGVYIEDGDTARLVRKVAQLSCLLCVASLLGALFNLYFQLTVVHKSFNHKRLVNFLAGCAFGAVVPACGYFGAKNGNRNLLWLFCACNLLSSINAVIVVWAFTMVLTSGQDLCQVSEDADAINPKDCPSFDISAMLFYAFEVLVASLAGVAFFWGKRLYEMPYWATISSMPPPVPPQGAPVQTVSAQEAHHTV